jgi:hypothetical protein
MCVSWGRSLLLSHRTSGCLTVLQCGCLEGLPLQQDESVIHHSSMYQYTSATQDAVMPYICIRCVITLCFYKSVYCPQPFWFERSVCHSQTKCFSVVPQPFGNHVGCWKDCRRSVSKVLGPWIVLQVKKAYRVLLKIRNKTTTVHLKVLIQ